MTRHRRPAGAPGQGACKPRILAANPPNDEGRHPVDFPTPTAGRQNEKSLETGPVKLLRPAKYRRRNQGGVSNVTNP